MPFDGNLSTLKIPEHQELPDPPEVTEAEIRDFERDPNFFTLESHIMERLFGVYEKTPMTARQIEESNTWMMENNGENPKEMRQLVCRYLKGNRDNPSMFTEYGIIETIVRYFTKKKNKSYNEGEVFLKKAA